MLLLGFGSAGFSTMQSTIILISSAPAMRGSALGVLGQCIGVAALGGLAVGAVADLFSAQVAVGQGVGVDHKRRATLNPVAVARQFATFWPTVYAKTA